MNAAASGGGQPEHAASLAVSDPTLCGLGNSGYSPPPVADLIDPRAPTGRRLGLAPCSIDYCDDNHHPAQHRRGRLRRLNHLVHPAGRS
jgi:hypothetical protein